MNSFRTQEDTLAALGPYPELEVDELGLGFVQNSEPKFRPTTSRRSSGPRHPTRWSGARRATVTSTPRSRVPGILDRLLAEGLSLRQRVQLRQPRCCAGCDRSAGCVRRQRCAVRGRDLSPADRRRSARVVHLAIRKGRSSSSSSATPGADGRGRDALLHRSSSVIRTSTPTQPVVRPGGPCRTLRERNSVLGLPLIKNEKTVDPADSSSPEAVEIESAMGAAIEVFPGATAIGVGRERFLPVKTTTTCAAAFRRVRAGKLTHS